MSKPAPAEAEEKPGKPGGKKKLIIIAAAVLLLGGGGAGLWFSGILPRLLGKGETAEAAHGEAAHGETHESGHAAPASHGAEKPSGHGGKEGSAEAKGGGQGGGKFMDMPDIIANLNAGPRKTSFVKLKVKLELSKPEDQAAIQAAMPRVLDLYQGYLREMRPEELKGTAGTTRLREELLARTNIVAAPAQVVAVLFTEMLVQ